MKKLVSMLVLSSFLVAPVSFATDRDQGITQIKSTPCAAITKTQSRASKNNHCQSLSTSSGSGSRYSGNKEAGY